MKKSTRFYYLLGLFTLIVILTGCNFANRRLRSSPTQPPVPIQQNTFTPVPVEQSTFTPAPLPADTQPTTVQATAETSGQAQSPLDLIDQLVTSNASGDSFDDLP